MSEGGAGREISTESPTDKARGLWLRRTTDGEADDDSNEQLIERYFNTDYLRMVNSKLFTF